MKKSGMIVESGRESIRAGSEQSVSIQYRGHVIDVSGGTDRN